MGCGPSINACVDSIGNNYGKDYKTLGVLGMGGYGKVMEAQHKASGKIVAVKILTKKLLSQDPLEKKQKQLEMLEQQLKGPIEFEEDREFLMQVRQRLVQELSSMTKQTPADSIEREIEMMRLCQHEFIMELVNTFESKNHQLLVLTRCFWDLQAVTPHRGGMRPRYARKWLAQVCAALQHIHELGVVHRDVKPDNVALDLENLEDADAIVSDLGLAKMMPSEFKDRGMIDKPMDTVAGTLLYMSPEAMNGWLGYTIDVFALGCTAFFMLTSSEVHSRKVKTASDAMAKSTKMLHVKEIEKAVDPNVMGAVLARAFDYAQGKLTYDDFRFGNADPIPKEELIKVKGIKRKQDGRLDTNQIVELSTEALDFCKVSMAPRWQQRASIKELLAHPFLAGQGAKRGATSVVPQ